MAGQDIPLSLPEAALAWAANGFFVFRCKPLNKEPLGGNGHKDATRDPELIRRWWAETPEANIGISLGHSAMFALDCDPPRGAETLASLELDHGLLPETLTIRTPRGGSHYFFRGRCQSSVHKLGPSLDTRGYGGYVVAPPSRLPNGNYTIELNTEIADGPSWIAATLAAQANEHKSAGVDLDLPGNIDRAERMLTQAVSIGDVAVSGAGGDDRTYRLACEVLGLGLSSDRAYDCIRRIWNPACEPPWDDDELRAKVRNAAEYSQNDVGAWAVAPAAEIFGEFAAARSGGEGSPSSRFYPYRLTETDAFREPEWLIPGLIPKRGTVQITGPKKSFKTFLTLDMALGIAAGVETFGHTPAGAPVVYIAGENASAMVLKHVPAWRLARACEGDIPFRVVQTMPLAMFREEMAEFVSTIKREGIAPAVVVIDTATRALRGLDENSAKDMGQFSMACEFIQRELDCTVIVIRHTGKDVSRGGRGSNVIEGDFDTILTVERHLKTKFVSLAVTEQRNAAEREHPYTFEGCMCGPSLVFGEITPVEFTKATRAEDGFSREAVGAALHRMGVTGEAGAVTTSVLADEMVPQLQGETPEERHRAVARAEKALKARARGTLEAYTLGDGAGLRWFLPATE